VQAGAGSPRISRERDNEGASWRSNWQQTSTTDAAGEFEFAALFAGGECELSCTAPDGSLKPLCTCPMGSRGLVLRAP